MRRERIERMVDQQPAHPPGGEQLQPLRVLGVLDLGLRPAGEVGVQPLRRAVQLVAQPPDRTAERVELVEGAALQPAGVRLGEGPLAEGGGAEEIVVVRDRPPAGRPAPRRGPAAAPGRARRRPSDRAAAAARAGEPAWTASSSAAADRPGAAGDPQGDGERGEDRQRDQAEAGPAQPLVGDEGRRPRDEQVEPRLRRMRREREEDPEAGEGDGEERRGSSGRSRPPFDRRAEPFEAQAAEERRADRRPAART